MTSIFPRSPSQPRLNRSSNLDLSDPKTMTCINKWTSWYKNWKIFTHPHPALSLAWSSVKPNLSVRLREILNTLTLSLSTRSPKGELMLNDLPWSQKIRLQISASIILIKTLKMEDPSTWSGSQKQSSEVLQSLPHSLVLHHPNCL